MTIQLVEAEDEEQEFFPTPEDLDSIYRHFLKVRRFSEEICTSLSDEDLQAQSMTDASPLKWHLAHTSWAFETFLLFPLLSSYNPFNRTFEYLFNSYYNAVGEQYPRAQRGLLTRPSRQEVLAYRKHVDENIALLIEEIKKTTSHEISQFGDRLNLLINHEQQHQELMFTDFKHLLSFNPEPPCLSGVFNQVESLTQSSERVPTDKTHTIEFAEGVYEIGHRNEAFYFDNEGPKHRAFVEKFALSSSLVSNELFLTFIEDGGYQKAEYWLSEAWYQIKEQESKAPIYWRKKNGEWFEHTFLGELKVALNDPVKHINYFEANAFANWANKRLPTEQEWEVAARSGNKNLEQMFGHLWQWTSSSYCAYPGFKPESGAIGEYNGKFMVNQYVLRGGSTATPKDHIRPSYRNFFYPGASWQFTGIRLAETL